MTTIHALILAALMTLSLHCSPVLAAGNSQDVLSTGVLDGVWSLTRYFYNDPKVPFNITSTTTGASNKTTRAIENGHCSRQERLTWCFDRKFFVQDDSKPDIMFGSSGIWDIQALVPISSAQDDSKKPELNPNFLKFRGYREGVTPMDLCIALQVIPPSKTGLDAKTNNDSISGPEIGVMVNIFNPKQCPTRWVLFGGTCAQGVDFLRGKCVEGACMKSSDKLEAGSKNPGGDQGSLGGSSAAVHSRDTYSLFASFVALLVAIFLN
ncbi:hypothetical protein BG005_004707 [Podila minutissima]|nr:hypothetical protein BG005_004707 [Podila minutissima]